MSKAHIDYLIAAGLRLPRLHELRWTTPEDPRPGDYERGVPWGPLAVAHYKERMRVLNDRTADRVGQMLWAENHRSIQFRYAEYPAVEVGEPYVYDDQRFLWTHIDPVAVLKAIDCYEYQSCEHPQWRESEAWAFCQVLRSVAIDALPGYEEAAWEVR